MSSPGTFENLRMEPIPDADAPLGPRQVRIATSAMAANFRDVMIALGLYPDEAAAMGVEASGTVIETASDAVLFQVGSGSRDCSRRAPGPWRPPTSGC